MTAILLAAHCDSIGRTHRDSTGLPITDRRRTLRHEHLVTIHGRRACRRSSDTPGAVVALHLDNDDEEDREERRSSATTDAVVRPRLWRAALREGDDAPRSATTDAVVLSLPLRRALAWCVRRRRCMERQRREALPLRRALAWCVDVVGAWGRQRRAALSLRCALAWRVDVVGAWSGNVVRRCRCDARSRGA